MHYLFMTDSYAKEFSATVVEAAKKDENSMFVILSDTAFSPNAGGLVNDTGHLIANGRDYKVVYAAKIGNIVSHEVQFDGEPLKPGDNVRGIVDWDRRYKIMRLHTAAHVLSSVFHEKAGALITGNSINLEQSRIDFSLDNFDRDKISEYVKEANEKAARGVDIKVYFLPKEEALKIPAIVKLAGAMPPDAKELRIVEIGSGPDQIDKQADGGVHVANTKEMGEIVIIKMENKGKNNRSVYFTLK